MENITTLNNFSEGARLRFYVNKFNNRGWGVVYMFSQLGEKRVRLSCGVKVKGEYWSKGNLSIPRNVTKVDRLLHERAAKVMEAVSDYVDTITYEYLRGESNLDLENQLKLFFNSFMRKRKEVVRVSAVWCGIIEECKESTKREYYGRLEVFKDFLREKGIGDDITNLTTINIRAYRDWLADSDRAASRGKMLLEFIGTMCKKMKLKGYTHYVDFEAIEPIKDSRTKEEKTDSKVALTHEEIERLANLELKGTKEIVRDLFLIQCYCGCRHEDLKLFLSSDCKVIEGERYIVFTPQKTEKHGTKAYIPLDKFYPQLATLWEKYKGLEILPSNKTYNPTLKVLGEMANIDREIEETQATATKKTKAYRRAYELLSSHDGRRSFVTNMIRAFGLTEEQIINMTAHADVNMIKSCYNCSSKEDREVQAIRAINGSKNTPQPAVNAPYYTAHNRSNKYHIEGLNEAKRVCRYLGIEYGDNITFEEALTMIEGRQWDIIDEYEINIEVLKQLFNVGVSMRNKIALLQTIVNSVRDKG